MMMMITAAISNTATVDFIRKGFFPGLGMYGRQSIILDLVPEYMVPF